MPLHNKRYCLNQNYEALSVCHKISMLSTYEKAPDALQSCIFRLFHQSTIRLD